MEFLENMPLLAGIGWKYFIGFGLGFAAGIGSGLALPSPNEQKISAQLSRAIQDGEIVVQNKTGERLTGDDLLAHLAQRYGGV